MAGGNAIRGTRVGAGMYLRGVAHLTERSVPAIPQSSVLYDDGQAYVYVVGDNNVVRRTELQLGARDGDYIEIISGLDLGQRVVGAGAAWWLVASGKGFYLRLDAARGRLALMLQGVTLDDYAPGLSSRVLARQVLTPLDLEREWGLTEGNIFQGELSLEQLRDVRVVTVSRLQEGLDRVAHEGWRRGRDRPAGHQHRRGRRSHRRLYRPQDDRSEAL